MLAAANQKKKDNGGTLTTYTSSNPKRGETYRGSPNRF